MTKQIQFEEAVTEMLDDTFAATLKTLLDNGIVHTEFDPSNEGVVGIFENERCIAVFYLPTSTVCKSLDTDYDFEETDRFGDLLDEYESDDERSRVRV